MEDTELNPPEPTKVERGVATDIALLVGAAASGPLGAATDYYLNRPKPPDPPKVELPPGVERD